MRMTPSRYMTKFAPAVVKKTRAKVAHVGVPSDGLSFLTQTGTSTGNVKDALQTAGVLTNFYVDDDRITCRAGYRKVATCPGGQPVDHLIPYYGQPERLAAATNHTLCDALTGTVWRSGFTSNDWHWTSFSNLGDREYTVMVNGADGVVAWDGGTLSATPDPSHHHQDRRRPRHAAHRRSGEPGDSHRRRRRHRPVP